MGRATVGRGRAVRLGILGAAGACAVGLMVPTVAAAAPPAAPPAGAIVVGTASASCPNPTYPTIQPAVTAAAPGATIYVCAGTYTGPVAITKKLRLLGAQYGRDARTGRTTTAQESVVTSPSAAFTVGAVDGLTVDGFTFSGSTGDGIDAFNRGSGFTFVDNVFTGNHNGMNVNAAGAGALDDRPEPLHREQRRRRRRLRHRRALHLRRCQRRDGVGQPVRAPHQRRGEQHR